MAKSANTILETEWSHFLDVDALEGGRTEISISPDKEESARLEQRLGILELVSLRADLVVSRKAGAVAFHVKGALDAKIRQNCVVTLEPVESHVQESFEAWFADPDSAVPIAKARQEKKSKKEQGEVLILEEYEDPEPVIEGKIDLGELVTQYLSLYIDPYPHAEGVEFQAVAVADTKGVAEDIRNPFAALKDWKSRLGKGEN